MDVLQSYFAEVVLHLASLFTSLLFYGLLMAGIGLTVGIGIVVLVGRSGGFKRPSQAWSIIAGLNYGYIPLLLLVFGGLFGSVYGAHRSISQLVENTAKPLARYGQSYLKYAITVAPAIPWSQYPGADFDNILASEMSARMGATPGSDAQKFMNLVNKVVLSPLKIAPKRCYVKNQATRSERNKKKFKKISRTGYALFNDSPLTIKSN